MIQMNSNFAKSLRLDLHLDLPDRTHNLKILSLVFFVFLKETFFCDIKIAKKEKEETRMNIFSLNYNHLLNA